MNIVEYLNTRLDPQIKYYSQKSRQCKNYHIRLSVIQMILAAMIPVISAIKTDVLTPGQVSIVLSFIGVTLVITTGLQNLNKYHEKWTNYRMTSERLKQEKFIFLTLSPEEKQNTYRSFVDKIEKILFSENAAWATIAQPKNAKGEAVPR